MPVETIHRIGSSAVVALVAFLGIARAQTLHDFVEAAAARNPELASLQGRRMAIDARQQAAVALTPGAPSLSGSYLTDQAVRNRNQREAQVGVSTPIWLPGEGTASRRLADAEFARSSPQAALLRLKIAGQVRDLLDEFALAQAEVGVSDRRLRDARALEADVGRRGRWGARGGGGGGGPGGPAPHARALEADVGRRTRAREASDADLLLARAERIGADAELHERRSALDQSRIEFQGLVGMAPLAAAAAEPVPPGLGPSLGTTHPRLEEAKGAVDVARANQTLVGLQVRDNPEIGVVARRNRDIGGNVFDNSVGVEVRVPFATQARNGPRRAAAQADLTEASAGYAAAEREVGTEQQKAQVGYDNARVQRNLARERARALTQQSGLVGRGYWAGEVSLLDYLRARALAYDADAANVRADIGVAKAVGRLNQAFGIVP